MATNNPSPPYEQVAERARLHRSGSDIRRRSQQVGFRVTPAEAEEIRAFAADRGMPVGELLRACWTYVHGVESAAQADRETADV
jgi:hypothetical protein